MQFSSLKQDAQIFDLLQKETRRQAEGMELIPSENYTSAAVMEAMGSILTNKYSEGYPGKRYYGGQENIDDIENIAIERAKQLFGAEHVNVQPYSGSPANTAIYFALLNYGDTIMGLKLDHGGHITHGLPISFSGRSYKIVPYLCKPDGWLDMDEVERLAKERKPKLIVAGFTAYPRDIDWKRFRQIADAVGAIAMADISHTAGLIAGKQLENPVPYFDVVMTTTHKTMRGPRGAIIMCKEKYAKDIDRAVFPGLQGGPHDSIIAGKAVCFAEALQPDFADYAKQIILNAKALANELKKHGFKLVTDGTDTHLILIDLTNKNITGKIAQTTLDAIGITLNKNTVPHETRSPMDPSGIRLGTPAITTRGFKEEHMARVATWINDALAHTNDTAALQKIKEEVKTFCLQFPIPNIHA
ncbi:serine hydroxymethyltransferase [Candidatus Falkowbacteria bacterium RIFOXYC2_FULL_47_12]|uniref:Serine hydroxymethyltransferase n=2 Tax=Candidatus Falkowiibacteriota TaxID=1752728 RepID=A0A1F5TNC3_9BACT|nr:MAG: serine hydroxymethyltransferase [Candidatus Falkowbacteria bacterium RIFOXYA2_FULL_47_9]OGF40386.1 MAG: serine hydroxymethyltransferase [Candidatus Falkowbacteria bacterium RIFOXYC2_FULL_47_12]